MFRTIFTNTLYAHTLFGILFWRKEKVREKRETNSTLKISQAGLVLYYLTVAVFVATVIGSMVLFSHNAFASSEAQFQQDAGAMHLAQQSATGIGEAGLDRVAGKVGFQDVDFATTIGLIINAVLGLVGSLFLVLLIYAGIMWMTAGGNEEKISKAKKIMTSAAVGLIVVVLSYAIASFVVGGIVDSITTQQWQSCSDVSNAQCLSVDDCLNQGGVSAGSFDDCQSPRTCCLIPPAGP